jgi:CBS domain-containing protein
MQIKKDGIFRSIDSKDFGLYQVKGWEKVINEPLPKLEEVAEVVEPVVEDEPIAEVIDEPIKEVIQDEPIDEIADEMPKSKKNRKK